MLRINRKVDYSIENPSISVIKFIKKFEFVQYSLRISGRQIIKKFVFDWECWVMTKFLFDFQTVYFIPTFYVQVKMFKRKQWTLFDNSKKIYADKSKIKFNIRSRLFSEDFNIISLFLYCIVFLSVISTVSKPCQMIKLETFEPIDRFFIHIYWYPSSQ